MWFLVARYDRGHMAPAGCHKGSREELGETFYLSNVSARTTLVVALVAPVDEDHQKPVGRGPCAVRPRHSRSRVHSPHPTSAHPPLPTRQICPQVGKGFNRDYWARVEEFTRRVAHHPSVTNTRVITGPLFLPHVDAEGGWRVDHHVLGKVC